LGEIVLGRSRREGGVNGAVGITSLRIAMWILLSLEFFVGEE